MLHIYILPYRHIMIIDKGVINSEGNRKFSLDVIYDLHATLIRRLSIVS